MEKIEIFTQENFEVHGKVSKDTNDKQEEWHGEPNEIDDLGLL